MFNSNLCLVSGHYPAGLPFAEASRLALSEYALTNKYDLFYDGHTSVPMEDYELHFRRSLIILMAAEAFPNAEWYMWIDTDIYPRHLNWRIEDQIDLNTPGIIYHLFHEYPWHFQVNTGVKLVHKSALHIEKEIYRRRQEFKYPFEQRAMSEYVIQNYPKQCLIHDPEKLNCIYDIHDRKKGLFIHVCARKMPDRNLIILFQTRKFFKKNPRIRNEKTYLNYHLLMVENAVKKIGSVLNNRLLPKRSKRTAKPLN